MSPERLQNAIGNIDDRFIDEAESEGVLPLRVWLPAASLAACILIMVALLPWRTIFSNNDPSVTDPNNSDNVIGFLDNDTTSFDTTKEPPVIDPDESTQQIIIEDTTQKDTQNITQSPNTSGPYPDSTQAPDTPGPSTDYNPNGKDKDTLPKDTTAFEEETTGPVVPNKPQKPGNGQTVPSRPTVLSRSVYPQQTKYSLSNLVQWRNEKNERINYYSSRVGNIDSFISLTLSELFANSENRNLIYSPVNAYMSLGMLAEASAGNSRAQLLDLLGADDITGVRSRAESLWNSTYRDDGIVTAILANSLWLDNSLSPKTAVTDILAKSYYASSFHGNMGDEEYNEMMRSWINEQTKSVLKDTVANESLDPESVLSLMSTVYFKAEWDVAFDPETTRNRVFHSPNGDVTAQFMYRDFIGIRYVGENFETTCLDLKEGGKMWLILPDEDVSLQSLFSDPEAMGFITGKTQKTLNYKNYSAYMWLFLPKFDINSGIDLADNLKNLGITSVFDFERADFSSLTDSSIYARDVIQSTRISIDESGCEAASVSGQLPDDSDSESFGFTLDRPFIFVVTSDSGLPLFVGTVNRPN